jgi:peroxiredoxin (alkyl hydroperoxide reductase subunit C)
MKKTLLILAFSMAIGIHAMAQAPQEIRIPLIGEDAPAFVAESTVGTIHFPGDYYGKWKILFSHPADFTPVCSTEILELADDQEEYAKLDAQVVVMSTDSKNSHMEWVSSLEDVQYKGQVTREIEFPLVSDQSLAISKSYGMIHPNSSSTHDIRGVFIIDPEDKIRAIFFYPMSTGRNLEEIKRTLIAIQLSEKRDLLTPANWIPGDDLLLPAPESKDAAAKLAENRNPKLYSLAWYIWFTKP